MKQKHSSSEHFFPSLKIIFLIKAGTKVEVTFKGFFFFP